MSITDNCLTDDQMPKKMKKLQILHWMWLYAPSEAEPVLCFGLKTSLQIRTRQSLGSLNKQMILLLQPDTLWDTNVYFE